MALYTHQVEEEDDIAKAHRQILSLEHDLDQILSTITNSKRGEVTPKETKKRSALAAYVSGTVQLVNNFVDQHKILLKKHIKEDLKRIGYKADKALRENIVLQTKSPIDIIPFAHVPRRHSYSIFGRRELRWGYGMHHKPFTEDGFSVTIASMPPNYMQSIHNHTLSEYCLILDTRTEGVYYPGKKKQKNMIAKKNQILHFSATTPHTLNNPINKPSRNMTFKKPIGLLDWRPRSNLNKVKIVRTRKLKGSAYKTEGNLSRKTFHIEDRFYDYDLFIDKIQKGKAVTKKHKKDKYYFVISGNIEISHKEKTLTCKKNDYIVIDKNTDYSLQAKTKSSLYSVNPHCNAKS